MRLLRLAFRNVFRQRRRSALTAMMMVGGFVFSSLSLGISDGSYSHIIDLFTRDHTGHVQIHKLGYLERPSLYAVLPDVDAVAAELVRHGDVESWAPRVYSPALAFRGVKTSGVRLIGVDPIREVRTTRLANKVSEGRFFAPGDPPNTAILGRALAAVLSAAVGDDIVLIAQAADGSIANDLFRVVGLTGVAGAGESRDRISCYLPIDGARQFLVLGESAHELAVVLTDQNRAIPAAREIAASLDEAAVEVHPWQEVERDFYRAMRADVQGMWLSLTIIMGIVAIGVLNTVLMTILERTREFGVLRALGTRPRDLFGLIVLETAFLAGLSLIPGALIGLLGNHLLSLHGIPLPVVIEYGGERIDHMLGKVSAQAVLLPGLVVFATAVVVSTLPALRAARIAPTRAMRAH